MWPFKWHKSYYLETTTFCANSIIIPLFIALFLVCLHFSAPLFPIWKIRGFDEMYSVGLCASNVLELHKDHLSAGFCLWQQRPGMHLDRSTPSQRMTTLERGSLHSLLCIPCGVSWLMRKSPSFWLKNFFILPSFLKAISSRDRILGEQLLFSFNRILGEQVLFSFIVTEYVLNVNPLCE